MTIFAATKGFAACVEFNWTPEERGLSLALQPLPDGDCAIFATATGCLPGLEDRMNPILDANNRIDLYADNVSINEGQTQPMHFAFGEVNAARGRRRRRTLGESHCHRGPVGTVGVVAICPGGSLIQSGRTTGCSGPSRLVFEEIQDHLPLQQTQPALLQGFSIQLDIDAAAKVVTECIVLP